MLINPKCWPATQGFCVTLQTHICLFTFSMLLEWLKNTLNSTSLKVNLWSPHSSPMHHLPQCSHACECLTRCLSSGHSNKQPSFLLPLPLDPFSRAARTVPFKCQSDHTTPCSDRSVGPLAYGTLSMAEKAQHIWWLLPHFIYLLSRHSGLLCLF